MINIAVLYSKGLNISFKNYVDNLMSLLKQNDIQFIPFGEDDPLPINADLFWDPSQSLPNSLSKLKKPLIITIQGDYELGIPAHELYGRNFLVSSLVGFISKTKLKYKWWLFRNRCSAIITISEYAKTILQKKLKLNGKKIYVAYHGVDLNVFNPNGRKHVPNLPYFLHVSHYQYRPNVQRKNLNRILQAYNEFPYRSKVKLKLIASNYSGPKINIEGVELITARIPTEELVSLYRGALGFVFPSLHEGFGVPIVEAMACGCPVITSNVTACPETADDAALLVNPRSVCEISQAMQRLVEDKNLCNKLREQGLKRAKVFTWQKSAEKHLQIFQNILGF